MIDVFVKVHAPNVLRLGMAICSVERWRMEAEKGNCKLWLLGAAGSLALPNYKFHQIFPLKEFQWASKQWAETTAESEVYVVADDDQLICSKDYLETGLNVFRLNAELGMAAGHMITGEVPAPPGESHWWESNSIGCPYFVRKGILEAIPEANLSQFDNAITKYVNERGFKTGFLRYCRYNHLGAGYSLVGRELNNPTAWMG